MDNHPIEYDRYLSSFDVAAIAFGCTLGFGAFTLPGSTFLPLAGLPGTLAALAIGVVIMLVIASNFAYLMREHSGTGGVYAYVKSTFGREHAFVCAWFLCLAYFTILLLNATSLFTVIRTLGGRSLQLGYRYYSIAGHGFFVGEIAASVVALAIVGLLFLHAKPFLQRMQTVLAVLLIAGVLLVGLFCLPHADLGGLFSAQASGSGGVRGIFTVVMLSPLLFAGFDIISLETAHFDFDVKQSNWITHVAILLIGLVLIVLTFITVSAVPEGYASSQAYLADLDSLTGVAAIPVMAAARYALGDFGVTIMTLTAIAAIMTSIIATYRGTARILATMAEDKLLPDRFNETSISILFIMLIAIVLSVIGTEALDTFMQLTAFGVTIAFAYTSACAWRTARAQGEGRIVVTGIIGTLAAAAFALSRMLPAVTSIETMSGDAFLVVSMWCLLGFLFYIRIITLADQKSNTSTPVSSVVIFLVLLYSVLMWLGKRLEAGADRSTLIYEGGLMLVVVLIGLYVTIHIFRMMRHRQQEEHHE